MCGHTRAAESSTHGDRRSKRVESKRLQERTRKDAMVRSGIDERVAGQPTLSVHQRQPDDWPRRGVPLRECWIGRDFDVAICEWIDGHKYLEQKRGRISFEYSGDDRVGFSSFFCCVENIRQFRRVGDDSFFVL